MKKFSRYQIATSIAILFHCIGLIGILYFDRDFFVGTTFMNLMLMFLLLVYTQRGINKGFLIFMFTCFITGIAVEMVGTKTGLLFGNYAYGDVLGPAINKVPLVIGVNWFIIMYCCGVCIHILLSKIVDMLSEEMGKPKPVLKATSIIVDGATLALLFDWIMEPVAVNLGFWTWVGGVIPFYNYACWFVISSLLMAVFHFAKFNKHNKFAVNLLLIQMMFFLVLRTLL